MALNNDYSIFMEAVNDLPAGWYCGTGVRQNSVFHRSSDKENADVFDKTNAVLFAAEFRSYGYPCEIFPEITPIERLSILEGN